MNSISKLICLLFIICYFQGNCDHELTSNITQLIENEIRINSLQAIENLVNQDDLFCSNSSFIIPLNHSSPTHLNIVKRYEHITKYGQTDVWLINQTFEHFTKPRNHLTFERNKDETRDYIKRKFQENGLLTYQQNFTSKDGLRGENIIGIKPGIKRDTDYEDDILLIGAHYDTVENSPGVDDNGSGCVALIELSRMLKNYPTRLDHTVIFVAFDLEENGLLGSIAFVKEYLIPEEIVRREAKFMGAYITDMIADYDPSPGSQFISSSFSKGIKRSIEKIEKNARRGDFLAMWARDNVDVEVADALMLSWSILPSSKKYKIIKFNPPLPEKEPDDKTYNTYATYFRSDHASFWYPKGPESLNAVLLTDMGPWRRYQSKCYHSPCDDRSQLTLEKLLFVKHIIQALFEVIVNNPPLKATRVFRLKPSVPRNHYSVTNFGVQKNIEVTQRLSDFGRIWRKDVQTLRPTLHFGSTIRNNRWSLQ